MSIADDIRAQRQQQIQEARQNGSNLTLGRRGSTQGRVQMALNARLGVQPTAPNPRSRYAVLNQPQKPLADTKPTLVQQVGKAANPREQALLLIEAARTNPKEFNSFVTGPGLQTLNWRGADLQNIPGLKTLPLNSINLGGANFGNADLSGANLTGGRFEGANFAGANLGGAQLGGARMKGANFERANLTGAELGRADFNGANMAGATMIGIKAQGTSFEKTNMAGALLGNATFRDCNMTGANMSGIQGAGLNILGGSAQINLSEARIPNATLSGRFDEINFGVKEFAGAKLKEALFVNPVAVADLSSLGKDQPAIRTEQGPVASLAGNLRLPTRPQNFTQAAAKWAHAPGVVTSLDYV